MSPETKKYPADCDIKIVWSKLNIALIVCSTLTLWPTFFYFNPITSLKLAKLLSVLGLYVDIIGVVIASLKTPYFGTFHDGGKIEVKRALVEAKYFQAGMLLIGFGFLLQALGSLL